MSWEKDKEYSFFHLMKKLYEAKKAYYTTGSAILTDNEYDSLEVSIKAIHGDKRFKEWYTVGYDEDLHTKVNNEASKLMQEFKNWFNNK